MNQDNKGQPQQGGQSNKPGQQGQQSGHGSAGSAIWPEPGAADTAAQREAWRRRRQKLISREPRQLGGVLLINPSEKLSRTRDGFRHGNTNRARRRWPRFVQVHIRVDAW